MTEVVISISHAEERSIPIPISTSIRNSHVPFTEKYRASKMSDIILNPVNRRILTNIIRTQNFPNLLFYGPPGTGKTTTIINLINEYQSQWTTIDKRAVIHLNASDERGIEIIRNQIRQFVHSRNLFSSGLKFVVLDEVDYMTKNAQQALRYLIQMYSKTVRFCLICNYVSRLDEGLQNELMRLNFNKLPPQPITDMLTNIVHNEGMHVPAQIITSIQNLCGSDVRSMINYIQTIQSMPASQNVLNITEEVNNPKKENTSNDTTESETKTEPKSKPKRNKGVRSFHIIDRAIWEMLFNDMTLQRLSSIAIRYQWDRKSVIKGFANFLIRHKPNMITPTFLSFLEIIMHLENSQSLHYAQYAVTQFQRFINALPLNEVP